MNEAFEVTRLFRGLTYTYVRHEIIRIKIKIGPLANAIQQYADFFSWTLITDAETKSWPEQLGFCEDSFKWSPLVPGVCGGELEHLMSCIFFKMAAVDEILNQLESWHAEFLASLLETRVVAQFKQTATVQRKIRELLISHYGGCHDIDIILKEQIRHLDGYLRQAGLNIAYEDAETGVTEPFLHDENQAKRLKTFLIDIYKREQVRIQCRKCADNIVIADEDHEYVTHDFFKTMGPSKRYLLAWIKANLLGDGVMLEIPQFNCDHLQEM